MGEQLDFGTILKALSLPEDIVQILDEMPEELRAYIIEEII